MVNQEEIVQKLKALVQEFKANYAHYKSLSEADIETKLVEELFVNILGWSKNDFRKQADVSRGEKRGRADYAFYIGDKIVFFLEVKRIGVRLDKEANKQVVSYALSKRVPFAISTNFEQMNIFCVEQDKAFEEIFRTFRQPEHYFEKVYDLLYLTKESFEQGRLLKEAQNEKRLKRRSTIDKVLLDDLMEIRRLIANDVEKRYKEKYEINEKDEIVQRIIDRLIFIRRAEDVGIQPSDLRLEDIKRLPGDKAYAKLKEIFKQYNAAYNSGLFDPNYDNDCDNITIDGDIIKKLVDLLYESKDKQYIYNFDWIDADVLGQVYEQYLGKILAQTKSGKAKLKEGQAHRKEQGIYYTPTYIVDYIVKNTIGELAKNKKFDLKKIKVLDPACGSGSFLMKAFDYLTKLRSDGKQDEQTKLDLTNIMITYGNKVDILKNNIFGVDLDPQAVEIAKLNLLLKAAENKHRLPILRENIKVGNSLIDDPEVAGNRAFKWEEEFKSTINDGGFDVIIGNPPYVDIKGMPPKQVDSLFEIYKSTENRINLYSLFVERAIQLLKKGGYFGFIIPNSILFNSSYTKLRRLLLDKVDLVKIVRLPDKVFEDAKVETIILIFKKKDSLRSIKTDILIYGNEDRIDQVSEKTVKQILTTKQSSWEKNENYVFNIFASEEVQDLLKNIEKNTIPLVDLGDFSLGITPYDKYQGHSQADIKNKAFHADSKKDESYKRLLSGADIIRYGIFWNGKHWIKYGDWLGASREKRFFSKPHIIVRQIVSGKPLRIYAGYTEKELINAQIGFNILTKDETKLKIKYLLAVLNSKLINFYHTEKYLDKSKNLFQKILIQNAKKFPIKVIDNKLQERICSMVDKLLSLIKQLEELKDKTTTEKVRLEKEVQKLDNQIDQEVYKIYGLTKDEIQIVEESLK